MGSQVDNLRSWVCPECDQLHWTEGSVPYTASARAKQCGCVDPRIQSDSDLCGRSRWRDEPQTENACEACRGWGMDVKTVRADGETDRVWSECEQCGATGRG